MTCPDCGKSGVHTCSPQALIVPPEPDMYERIMTEPIQHDPGVKLIKGEVGVIDGGIRFVEMKP